MLNFHRLLLTAAVATSMLLAFELTSDQAVAQSQPKTQAIDAQINPGGMRRYERGKWSVLALKASNRLDEEANGALSVFLKNDVQTQFTRRYWVPANAIRRTWLPIRPHENIASEQKILNASVLNLAGPSDAAILNRTEGEQLIGETLLALDPAGLHAGMITNRLALGNVEPETDKNEAYETAVAVRILHNGDRTISSLHEQFISPYPESYEALDQLIISNDRIAIDSGGLSAIRTWIARGGRAWIMLDKVDIQTVRSLLGNDTPYEVIDRLEFNEFLIETPRSTVTRIDPQETWISEIPVEFVRVALDAGKVYSSIDGWPASFSIPFGNGEVFFTTLGPRGWRYQLDEFAHRVDDNRPTSGPTEALKFFAINFNQQAVSQAESGNVLTENLQPILSDQIGYRIPSRNIAAIVLGLSCILIAIAGIWLARRQQLERIAWVVPLGTIIPALVLIAVGNNNTSSIPASASVLRLANVNSGTREVHADVLTAYYSPETVEIPLETDLHGVINPDLQGMTGVAKRAVWDDDGKGRWNNVDVASGSVRFVREQESRVFERPIRAIASFGQNGLSGRIEGADQLGTPADAVVASPAAPFANATIESNADFHVSSEDVLSEQEFITEAMLTDRQQTRQTIYREIFSTTQASTYPRQTTLFVWGDETSWGANGSDIFQQGGSTLFAIPLEIQRTPSRQTFLIPTTFVTVSSAAKNLGRSLVFDPATCKWLEGARVATETPLQFALPREVMPCQIKSATIALKVHAPSRTVSITGIRNGASAVIESHKSPSGVLTFKIDDPELLQLNENGALRFGISVSKAESQLGVTGNSQGQQKNARKNRQSQIIDENTVPVWKIDYLRLQATGQTQ